MIYLFLFAVLVEVKDYYTGALKGYAVEAHVDSSLVKCVKRLEQLLEEEYLGEGDVLKSRNTFMNFMKINIRGYAEKTDSM